MVSQEPINLHGAETTLRLQHQTDRGRRGRLQTIQTVPNHVDGFMGRHIQLEPGLIAQPLLSPNKGDSRPCCKRHVRPPVHNARADQSRHQAAAADPSVPIAKPLGQEQPRRPLTQQQAASGRPDARLTRRIPAFRLHADRPSGFRVLRC